MISIWLLAMRPKTLVAAFCPVIIGTMLSYSHNNTVHWHSVWLILMTALFIQIGTNFANDYYDFIKGADTKNRKGPTRATQSGLVPAETMKKAMIITFGLALVCGAFLVTRGGWPILLIGVLSICFGILYTGGPYPLGYNGLGDVFVFIFFGPIAVTGTYYLMTLEWWAAAAWIGAAPGFISTALLAVNNLRDIEEDTLANKRTLAVRFGIRFTQIEFMTCLFLAIVIPLITMLLHDLSPMLIFTFFAVLPACFLIKDVLTLQGADLNKLLGKTGGFLLIYTLLFTLALLIPFSQF